LSWGYNKTAAMAAVIGSAVISWALPGYRMVPGSSVYKAKGYRVYQCLIVRSNNKEKIN
jgi:hypothetical protein